jgi:hypothetical protein
VTEDQIEQFNLPSMPKSKETIHKVNQDTRKNGFIKKYGKLYIVELDALLATVPGDTHFFVEMIHKFGPRVIVCWVMPPYTDEFVKQIHREHSQCSSYQQPADSQCHKCSRKLQNP